MDAIKKLRCTGECGAAALWQNTLCYVLHVFRILTLTPLPSAARLGPTDRIPDSPRQAPTEGLRLLRLFVWRESDNLPRQRRPGLELSIAFLLRGDWLRLMVSKRTYPAAGQVLKLWLSSCSALHEAGFDDRGRAEWMKFSSPKCWFAVPRASALQKLGKSCVLDVYQVLNNA